MATRLVSDPGSRLDVGAEAVVAVAVAGVWRTPEAARAVDEPVLGGAPDVRAWLAAMDDEAKRALVGRLDTQALLGERVVVTELVERWARVVVPDQPSEADERGYPGWIPQVQLERAAHHGAGAGTGARFATVVWPRAALRTVGAEPIELSFGTRLPCEAIHDGVVRVELPFGALGEVDRSAVVVHDHGTPALQPTPDSVIRTAQRFLGLPYLWAGRSGFGFDCSGLVQLVHAVHGVRLPRDTGPQSLVGDLVEPRERRAGDLVFFERGGDVHHVVTYIGSGVIIESPRTGLAVRELALEALPYASEVTVTRRVLPPS